MDNKNFKPKSIKEFFYEIIESFELKWYQILYLKVWFNIDSLWTKILCNTIYRKYKIKI